MNIKHQNVLVEVPLESTLLKASHVSALIVGVDRGKGVKYLTGMRLNNTL